MSNELTRVAVTVLPDVNPEIFAHRISQEFTTARVGFAGDRGITVDTTAPRAVEKFAVRPGHVESITANGETTSVTPNFHRAAARLALVARAG